MFGVVTTGCLNVGAIVEFFALILSEAVPFFAMDAMVGLEATGVIFEAVFVWKYMR